MKRRNFLQILGITALAPEVVKAAVSSQVVEAESKALVEQSDFIVCSGQGTNHITLPINPLNKPITIYAEADTSINNGEITLSKGSSITLWPGLKGWETI